MMPMALPKTSRSGRAWITAVIGLAAFAAGIAATVIYTNRTTSADRSAVGNDGTSSVPARVSALGRLQPAGGVIPVYGPPGDRIKEMKPLSPGMHLKSGEPIATLA